MWPLSMFLSIMLRRNHAAVALQILPWNTYLLFSQLGKSAQKACGGHVCIDRKLPDADLTL